MKYQLNTAIENMFYKAPEDLREDVAQYASFIDQKLSDAEDMLIHQMGEKIRGKITDAELGDYVKEVWVLQAKLEVLFRLMQGRIEGRDGLAG
jgi:hypothetical protein